MLERGIELVTGDDVPWYKILAGGLTGTILWETPLKEFLIILSVAVAVLIVVLVFALLVF